LSEISVDGRTEKFDQEVMNQMSRENEMMKRIFKDLRESFEAKYQYKIEIFS
jgi:hypothetical protein